MTIKNSLLGPVKAQVKLVGVSFRKEAVSALKPGAVVRIKPEPTNPHDKNAMRVTANGEHVGYLPREIARRITEEMPGTSFVGHISDVTEYEGAVVGGFVIFDHVDDGTAVESTLAPAAPNATVAAATSTANRPVF